MTICTKCARAALDKYRRLAQAGRPIKACVHCKKVILENDPHSKRWRPDRFEHYFCEACADYLLYRPTNICLNCKKPITQRGYGRMKRAQSTPGQGRPAYMKPEYGRKVA